MHLILIQNIMKIKSIAIVVAALAAACTLSAQEWAPAGDRIRTKWAEEVSPTNAHPEYPRPQMVRKDWKSLNGLWDYAVTPKSSAKPSDYDGKILVPFAIESSLSGVGKALTPDDALWYRTTFTVPSSWKGKNVKLYFDAVDWSAEVTVNGIQIGGHTGGYTRFGFDITPYLTSGTNTLEVKVIDNTNDDFQPRGKQVLQPSGIWYTAVSGIWQSVWLEPVASAHITDYYPVSNIRTGTLDINVTAENAQQGDVVSVSLLEGGIGLSTDSELTGKVLAEGKTIPGGTVTLNVPDPQLWSPDSPYLYGLSISILRNGKKVDTVTGYTSLRESSEVRVGRYTKLLGLNGKAMFQYGPLDQGWWPDGLYTAPTDEALKFDIQKTKDFGYNMIRKHIKVEPDRWFYYCDQLGIVVWQDMPCFGAHSGNVWGQCYYGEGTDFPATDAAKANYYKEWTEIIMQKKKFQCIVSWIPFNEAWSQFDTKAVVEYTCSLDPTRLINQSSGGNWEIGVGDILDNHHYPQPFLRMLDHQMINVLGEYGGIGLPVEGHLWQTDKNWGYVQFKSGDDVLDQYEDFARQLKDIIQVGCSGAVYTQTTDVEGEVNGLMTYDRVVKVDEDRLRAINESVIDSFNTKFKVK